ncbi:MAG: hypothetical protein V1793_22920 [Pseudomonadota bacterium]
MDGRTRFRINSPQIIHETIVLNLTIGAYDSLNPMGGLICQ